MGRTVRRQIVRGRNLVGTNCKGRIIGGRSVMGRNEWPPLDRLNYGSCNHLADNYTVQDQMNMMNVALC